MMDHSGIQPWSQGPLFPAVIARIETYNGAGIFRPVTVRYELTLHGHVSIHAARAAAEAMARHLLVWHPFQEAA